MQVVLLCLMVMAVVRRSKMPNMLAPIVTIEEHIPVYRNQSAFMNTHNKSGFIHRAPSIPIIPIFLSVPIIFLYFDEIHIFSYIIFTPKKCRDARMSRHSSYAKMHTWFNRIDVTEQATLLTKSDHGMLF